MHDETSLPRLLADDLDAHFELLVRTYQDRLFAFALRLTNNARDAEEATQDGLVRAYRACGTILPRAAPSSSCGRGCTASS